MWHILDSQVPSIFSSLQSVMGLEGEIITQAPQRDVIRLKLAEKTYYLKRYTMAGKGLRSYLGRSRVRAEWENLQYFWHMNIPAPKLLAYGENRPLLSDYEAGAYVMQAIPNVVPLSSIEQYPELLDDRPWRIALLKLIASHIRTLHEDHFAHGDLYWRNILMQLSDEPKVYFIDCPQGAKYFGPRLTYQKIRDLACLAKDSRAYLSRTDLLRFFLAYRGHEGLTSQDKSFIRKLNQRLK